MSFPGNWENSCIIITGCWIAPIVNLSDAIRSTPVWDNNSDSDSDNYHTSFLKWSSGNHYTDSKDWMSSTVTNFENENGCDRRKNLLKYKSILRFSILVLRKRYVLYLYTKHAPGHEKAEAASGDGRKFP